MASPEEMIKQCISMLQMMNEDGSIPRNIRRAADETIKLLSDEKKSTSLRAASALSRIDEISNDANMPMHVRTKVWEIASTLEAIPLD